MIIDKISIVKLEILFNIRTQLTKARGLLNSSMEVFGNLLIIIVMRDFYQFSLLLVVFFGANLRLTMIIMIKLYDYLFLQS